MTLKLSNEFFIYNATKGVERLPRGIYNALNHFNLMLLIQLFSGNPVDWNGYCFYPLGWDESDYGDSEFHVKVYTENEEFFSWIESGEDDNEVPYVEIVIRP